MAGAFTFQRLLGDPTLGLGDFVTLASASKGAGSFSGIENPGLFHLIGTGTVQASEPVVYVPLALRYNQSVKLDLDFTAGNFRLLVLDARGNVVAQSASAGSADANAPGTDPPLNFKPLAGGAYFLAITSFDNTYLGDWQFANGGTVTGSVQLDIGAANLPPLSRVDFTNNFIRDDDASYRVLGNNDGNIINFHFADGSDIVEGRGGNDNISLGVGNDVGRGGPGNDALGGWDGGDILAGGTGDDRITGGAGHDQMFGGIGNDLLDPGLGNDFFSGGAGLDTVNFINGGGTKGVNVDLTAGTVTGGQGKDTVSGVENIIGTNFPDLLKGNSKANSMYGFNGDDTIDGAGGNDILYGHGDNDDLKGGIGNDNLFGDVGTDILSGGFGKDFLNGGGDNDIVFGDSFTDTLVGEDGNDSLLGGDDGDSLDGGNGKDRLFGGDGNDTGAGGAGNDLISGGSNEDSLSGGGNSDTIDGGFGDDTVNGDAGNDTVDGGYGSDIVDGGDGDDGIWGGPIGSDTLTGGEGTDRFEFKNALDSLLGGKSDRITDFNSGQDKIALLFDGNTADGNPGSGFQFIGDSAFSGEAGQLRYAKTGPATIVSADLDGDKSADFSALLDGRHNLFETDFQFLS